MAATRLDAAQDPGLDDFYADVAEAGLQPLWLQQGLLTPKPERLSPHLWRGKTIRHLAGRSGDLIGVDRGGDRRVLALSHPDLGGLPFATHTIWAGVQFLKGGERAPAHRHSPGALRFVLEGSGVWTLVNGDPVLMEPGDLILTPSDSWHEHHNPGDAPMLWFDGLDLPLVHGLDGVFFEPGPDDPDDHERPSRSRSEQLYGYGGLLPVDVTSAASRPASGRPPSSLMAFRWERTDAVLKAMQTASEARATAVRYADPSSGRDILPTLRAEMHRLPAGWRTTTTRTVGSAVCLVFRGSGATTIDGLRLDWAKGDVLVLPSWAAIDHQAGEEADLFVLSDAPVMEALGLDRQVVLPGGQ